MSEGLEERGNLAVQGAAPTGVVRLLDPHTVNQIAAGEVVERPASVVKELVENSLDAGSRRIEVELLDAGRRKIRVTDDGCGMEQADVIACLERHATSKIRSAIDLLKVVSYGFRGEAIPSISSISRLTLRSGTGEGARYQVIVEGSRVVESCPVAGPRGTEIVVEDLFLNVPARLKFLKSDTTEIGQCVEVVTRAALANPHVSFRLVHGSHVLVSTTGSEDLLTTVAELWGRDVARALVPMDRTSGGVRCHGLISPPHFTKPTRAMQWLFVNGRPVKNRTMTAALDHAMRSITPERRYPVAVLLLEIASESVDVNVSPSKSEVKFHQEGLVFDAVRRSVRDALVGQEMVPSLSDLAMVNDALSRPSLTVEPGNWSAPPQGSSALIPTQPDPIAGFESGGVVIPLPGMGGYAEQFLDGLRVLGQVDRTFIIAENNQGLLVIDQHVAHERILYEMLVATRGSGAIEVQNLLVPEVLHLDRRAATALTERLGDLAEIGFGVEPFGESSFLVRSIPASGRGQSALELLHDLIDQIADGKQGEFRNRRDDVLIMCSCKMAIKAGDPLGLPEMVKLLHDLAATENPYLCPHGRPITVVMPKSDLYKKFHR